MSESVSKQRAAMADRILAEARKYKAARPNASAAHALEIAMGACMGDDPSPGGSHCQLVKDGFLHLAARHIPLQEGAA